MMSIHRLLLARKLAAGLEKHNNGYRALSPSSSIGSKLLHVLLAAADVSNTWTLDIVLDESPALRQPVKKYKWVPIGAIGR